ncbi:ADP-ribosylglycohydrolase family protein [Polymorphospora rubra]|uniref:ADP-ribosylglycohydrolase family protein n=1 Tax=Polymorphospora rubra TaxID=338584 RepID=UPI0033F992D5
MAFTLYAQARTALARDSLAGLSVGDALGAQFFVPGRRPADLAAGRLPEPVWEWTDDTEMACSVFAELARTGRIDRDALAAAFADRCEPNRGYGPGAFTVLRLIRTGTPWPVAAATAFDGQGSLGNGAAMRVAPLGAYFADSVTEAAAQATASAEVTHAHPDGIAGAVAVAVAASLAAQARLDGRRPPAADLVAAVAASLDHGPVRHGLDRAGRLIGRPVDEAAYELGNGAQVTARDTVPFTVWVAARFLDDYPAAVRACVEAGGDVDTTAAIVGGIVAAHTGTGTPGGVPDGWLAAREPLPDWTG